MTYEEWKNYETWCVALWIDNDYDLYHFFTKFAKANTPYNTAIMVKEWLEEGMSFMAQVGVYTDLLNAAISEVDFMEIAEHLQEE